MVPVHITPRQGQCFSQPQALTDEDDPKCILTLDRRGGQESCQLVMRLDITDEGLPVVVGDLRGRHGVGRVFGQQVPRDRRAQGGVQYIVHVTNGPARIRLVPAAGSGARDFD